MSQTQRRPLCGDPTLVILSDRVDGCIIEAAARLGGRESRVGADAAVGKAEYRQRVNRVLAAYGQGYELSDNGEILTLPEPGFESIHTATLPLVSRHTTWFNQRR